MDGYKIPEFVVNNKIYTNINKTEKLYPMVYFLDNDDKIPDCLYSLLYPNTKLQIRLFNGSSIQHNQHLGFVDEETKKNILSETKTFLYTKTDYFCEACMCGCDTVNISTGSIDKPIKTEVPPFITYQKIIEDFIL